MKNFLKKKNMELENHLFPHLGQRILKTTLAVYLCFLTCHLRYLLGQEISAEAAITAIICMQPYVKDTKEYALNRFIGTLIGSFWGLLFLFLLSLFPFGEKQFLLYALMACGVLLSLYTSVLFRQPDTSSLSAIVYICVVISFPSIEDPLVQAGNRIVDVLIGTSIAIIVNVFRLPRARKHNQIFFLRTKDLVPDRYAQIAPAVLFQLNYLLSDGAKICLVSEHAPAFFTSQMSMAKVNEPLIVMDGAAIYDIKENQYLYAQTLPESVSLALRAQLDHLGIGYFIYTIHRNKTCIFHQGDMTKPEKEMLEVMKKTPYRSYLDGEIYDSREIVYIKIINTKEKLDGVIKKLYKNDAAIFRELRTVARPHKEAPNCQALYLYSSQATVQNAQKHLLEKLRENEKDIIPQELYLRSPYRSERDALYLLHKVKATFEPLKIPKRKTI